MRRILSEGRASAAPARFDPAADSPEVPPAEGFVYTLLVESPGIPRALHEPERGILLGVNISELLTNPVEIPQEVYKITPIF